MGCGCVGPTSKDKYSIENIISNKYSSKKEITSKYQITDYVKRVFNLINKIRTNPSEFISAIEQAEKYIIEKNDRKIFQSNGLKISLNEGKSMFKDCADYLKTLSPMEELNFCDDIVLECPTEEIQIKDKNIFREKVLEKKNKYGILAYFKDAICIPEISVLLMMVDDSAKNPRKKREALLNPNYKFIGISSSDVGNISDNTNSNNNNGIVNKEENVEKNKDNNENNEKKEENKINNEGNNNINEKNGIKNENNNIDNDNAINKIMRNEIKHKPFCAYFALK